MLISATGLAAAPAGGMDTAIGSLEVSGNVRHCHVLAGYGFRYPGGLPKIVPLNADASIGKIFVGGNWIASTVLAGVGPGLDGFDGTRDDSKLRDSVLIRDNTTIASQIAAIVISGYVSGTRHAGDSFGIAAEEILSAKISGRNFSFEPGAHNGKDFYFVGSTGPGPTGGRTDFTIHEAIA